MQDEYLLSNKGGDTLRPSDLPNWIYAIVVSILMIVILLMILSALY
jgi:hypothetical protein